MYWMDFESFSKGRWCFRWEGPGWDEDTMFRKQESKVKPLVMGWGREC